MNLPSVTIKNLLEAGVHLGHKTFRWNPKMNKYIFGAKNSIHIIDLVQTLEMINVALQQLVVALDRCIFVCGHDAALNRLVRFVRRKRCGHRSLICEQGYH